MSTLRTGGFLVLLGLSAFATTIAAPAWADAPVATATGSQQVTLPTGKTIDAQKFVSPAAGTIEAAIIDSMTMIGAGQFDEWITKYCPINSCPDPAAKESLKAYQLKSSSKTAHECMTSDGGILVTRREDVPAEGATRVYVFCGPNRMPAPATLKLDGTKWMVNSFSW